MPAARIAVLPNGVDLQRFRPGLPPPPGLRERLGLEGRRVVLAPTRLVPRKGVDRLVEAWPAGLARHPRALLLVVGEWPQRPTLEARVAALGLADAVRFAGTLPAAAMPGAYALAELVALPNRAEPGESDGLPLVFLEANACGRPVLGGRAGGTAEAVRDGENGLLVAGEDSAALAARPAAGALAVAQGAGWPARAAAFRALCRDG